MLHNFKCAFYLIAYQFADFYMTETLILEMNIFQNRWSRNMAWNVKFKVLI